VKIAADANVLISSVFAGRSGLVLRHPSISEVVTTSFTFSEVEQYVRVLAKKKRLPMDILQLAVAALPVTIVERAEYATRIPEAVRRIGKRDPDDAELLALALNREIPIWSNDRDFEDAGIEWFTTEKLLRRLRIID
jgi:predicted nucleic acid-binding protein